jgi:hypothetical protein
MNPLLSYLYNNVYLHYVVVRLSEKCKVVKNVHVCGKYVRLWIKETFLLLVSSLF